MKLFGTGCTENTYGFECSQKCGKCRNRSQCNHVTGTCPKGCDKGIYGDKCVSGLSNYHNVTSRNMLHCSRFSHIVSVCRNKITTFCFNVDRCFWSKFHLHVTA